MFVTFGWSELLFWLMCLVSFSKQRTAFRLSAAFEVSRRDKAYDIFSIRCLTLSKMVTVFFSIRRALTAVSWIQAPRSLPFGRFPVPWTAWTALSQSGQDLYVSRLYSSRYFLAWSRFSSRQSDILAWRRILTPQRVDAHVYEWSEIRVLDSYRITFLCGQQSAKRSFITYGVHKMKNVRRSLPVRLHVHWKLCLYRLLQTFFSLA